MQPIELILLGYVILINIVTFAYFAVDKYNAVHKLTRISQDKLMAFAIAGSSIGALLAMVILRHKTRHVLFTLGIPLILITEVAILYFLFGR